MSIRIWISSAAVIAGVALPQALWSPATRLGFSAPVGVRQPVPAPASAPERESSPARPLTRPAPAAGRLARENSERGKASGDQERARKKKFGDSLRHLKWDESKAEAIEKEKAAKPSGDTIRLSSLMVVVDAMITDARYRPVAGLTKEDIDIKEDGRPQDVAVFAQGQDQKMARQIILILDMSGSQRACLDASVTAAKTLVSKLGERDAMAVVTDNVELIQDYTTDKAALDKTLDRLLARTAAAIYKNRRPEGRSLNFTALFAALRELTGDASYRHVIIFQTDGDEAPTLRDQPGARDFEWNMPERQYGLSDVYRAGLRSNAVIYTVIPSPQLTGLSQPELLEAGRAMLEQMERARFKSDADYKQYKTTHPMSDALVGLFAERFAQGQAAALHVAELTGGWGDYLVRPEDAEAIYGRILSDINERYAIGYYPDGSEKDSRPRHIRIAIKGHPEFNVHSRDTYLPPVD